MTVMLAIHKFPARISSLKRVFCATFAMDTADLCDSYGDLLQYVEPIFRDFGRRTKFDGKISTVKCHEDNSCVKTALAEPGDGRVLVVDGGGSLRRALLGDNVAATALKNNWSGVIIYGCVRDTCQLEKIDLGVKALAQIPRKTEKKNVGMRDIPVTFAGVTFRPNEYVYADRDGIVVSDKKLTLEGTFEMF
ncbi:uncharacterized protein LOC114532755 [Dendronephthya gigantea]|uniref:uncharacterized protein LOC114532755 n=1 Tax=Dendronephthya gigantea TaxID=151771 RepID=UPI00106A590A|nr:uncharacterized protein LOC114532755 [Dendronephthya gigantea]